MSPMVMALATIGCCPPVLIAASTSPKLASMPTELAGSKSSAILLAFGTISRRTSSRFAPSSLVKKFTPVMLPAGLLMLATKPAAARRNHCCLPNQVGCQHWQATQIVLGPAEFDRNILPFDIADFLQALPEA